MTSIPTRIRSMLSSYLQDGPAQDDDVKVNTLDAAAITTRRVQNIEVVSSADDLPAQQTALTA